ncbi:hypothetical protein MY834_06880, partial [Haemophilus influenzae]
MNTDKKTTALLANRDVFNFADDITTVAIANPTITYSIAAPENEAINLGDIFAKSGNINVRAATIRNKGKLS